MIQRPPVDIRPARSADVEPMAELLAELFAVEADFAVDPERQRRGLRLLLSEPERACALVAEAEGRVVGMVTVQVLVSTAEGGPVGLLEDLVVRADRRGRGVGTALLRAAEDWARGRELLRLQLLADRDNHPALEFYRRLGWAPTRLGAWRRHP